MTEAGERRLRDLGAHLAVPAPGDVTAAVLARIATAPARRRSLAPRLTAAAAALVVAFGVAAAVSPTVRAGVERVLRFAGIEVHSVSGRPPVSVPSLVPALPGERVVSLSTARSLAAFRIYLPAGLGALVTVTVSDGTPPRVVSLHYRSSRVDEFDGGLSFVFSKMVFGGLAQKVRVGTITGYWVPGPQEVIYIDRNGQEHTESAHMAGNTLIWQRGSVTVRLEGRLPEATAIAIAESFS
jgi:hypothetical protein